MRELRGGVHIEAVRAVGLAASEACYLDDVGSFKLHGYGDADVPTVTPALVAAKAAAEQATDEAMAARFEVLSEGERAALAGGVDAMVAALSNPTPR